MQDPHVTVQIEVRWSGYLFIDLLTTEKIPRFPYHGEVGPVQKQLSLPGAPEMQTDIARLAQGKTPISDYLLIYEVSVPHRVPSSLVSPRHHHRSNHHA